MDSEVPFGLWLKRRRRALDLTQDALAQRVGCSLATIQKIEADERRPSRQIADLLARALELPPADHETFLRVARGERRADRLPSALPSAGQLPGLAPPPRPTNLPVSPTPLIGREGELAALAELLRDPQCRLVTLVGPGGIGKTRLALEVACAQYEAYPHGAYVVSLASVSSVEFIITTIADVLHLAFYGAGPTDPEVQLFSYLREKTLLLLLDNFEHLLTGVSLVAEVLEQAPGVKLLVTSRERLELRGEWVFDLQGLPVPPESSSDVESYSAVALFVALARRVRSGFVLSEQNRTEVARICRSVAGMPLGIELAAAWTHMLSCREIAHQIERNVDFLAATRRDVPERHRSLRAAFDHSWKLLSEEEQDVLCRLSVFRGGLTREAAERVAGASLVLLSSLVSKSLVLRTEAGRYDLHEPVRQFAEAHLEADSGEAGAGQGGSHAFEARRAHAVYYLALAEEAGPQLFGSQQAAWKEQLEQEHDNIRAALEWLLKSDGPDAAWRVEVALRLAGPLHRFWHGRHGNEGRRWLERGLGAETTLAVHVPASVRARALETASRLAEAQSDYDAAQAMLREGLALSREAQEPGIVADVLDALGDLAWLQGDFAQAEVFYEECLAIRQGSRTLSKIALSLISLGNAAVERGDYARADRVYAEGLVLCREVGDVRSTAMALYGLGLVAVEQNDGPYAALRLKEALALFNELRNDFDVALCLECLAYVAVMQGRTAEGVLLWGANETLLEALHMTLFGNYRVRRERGVATARNQLDEAAIAAAWAKGRAMGWERAAALVGGGGEQLQISHDPPASSAISPSRNEA